MAKIRRTAFLLLLVVSVIWGAASPVVKHTLTWFDPWLFLTYRFFISTLIAFPMLIRSRGEHPKKPGLLWLLILTGFVSAPLSLFLFFEALTKTTALSGSLITATGPLFLIAGGALFFRDRISRAEKRGMAVAMVGTLVTVLGPLVMNGHADTLGKIEGNAIMLLAVITDIAAALMSKEALKKGVAPGLIAQVQFIVGFVVFLPLLIMRQPPETVWNTLTHAPLEAHLGVLYMAVLSGSLAYTWRNMAVKSIEVSESALYGYLQPVWAAILSVLWLREPVTPSYIVGGLVIAAGVWLAERRARR